LAFTESYIPFPILARPETIPPKNPDLIDSAYENAFDILYNTKYNIVLVGSVDDVLKSKLIPKNKKIINLIGKTNINEVGYVVSKSKLLIGNDSGVGHIASALNIPVVSIFGPGFYKQWKPYGQNCHIIRTNVCNPCGNNPDCEHIKCLNLITSNQVIDVVEKILDIET
jgi:ADP-heptose:LPS heptosyltransferase